jgi:hypothetical protein
MRAPSLLVLFTGLLATFPTEAPSAGVALSVEAPRVRACSRLSLLSLILLGSP